MSIRVFNPANGSLIKEYQMMTAFEVFDTIEKAHQEYEKILKKMPDYDRADLLLCIGKDIEINIDRYTKIITQEMGKPIKQARIEAEKSSRLCHHYGRNYKSYLKSMSVEREGSKSYTSYKPIGIVLGIMPWNYPLWQALRFIIPNLLLGNVCLLKHAPNVTGSALAIQKLITSSATGMEHFFHTLVIDVPLTKKVIHHPLVRGVAFTGSEQVGRSVAIEASSALKKVVLELGGSDPYLILEDADLDLAAQQCVRSRLNNAGQVCIAAKRIIVLKSVYDAFVEKVLKEVDQYVYGDPMDEDTTLGPLATATARENLHQQVLESIQKGAKCVRGGKPLPGPGYYYPPTVLLDVKKGMPAFDDELFGPVVALIRVSDETEAIKVANDSRYGLGAAVFTRDLERGERIVNEELNVGICQVNSMVSSDPKLPFGGVKNSGFGRELGAEGVHEFSNIKTISITSPS